MQAANPPTSAWDRLTTQPPLMWFSLAFLGGIVWGSLISLSLGIWIGLGFLTLFLSVLARMILPKINLSSFTFLPVVFILFFGIFSGAARYQFSVPKIDASHIAFYNDREYDQLITGYLTEPPDYRDTYTYLRLQVETVDTGDGNLPAHGLILVRTSNNQTFEYGERIRLRGKLKTPLENQDFSYRDYRAAKNINSYMTNAEITVLPGNGGNQIKRALYVFKQKSLDTIYRLFPDSESSLLAGILLGVDTGLTQELQQAFKNTGTAHIIAISGFNISIIAGIFFVFFCRFFGDRRGTLIAILCIALYTFIVGADAMVIRAAVMGTLALWARQLGRYQTALNSLFVVAFFMCIWNPLYVLDVGFQLSFFATLGIILYSTPFSEFANRIITRYIPSSTGEKAAGLLSEFVLLTLAAQLTTIPIMAYHFQHISLLSFIANPFILPAQPSVMIIGGLAVLLSLVWFPLGQITAWIAWPFVIYTIRVVELFDLMPHGTIFLGDFSVWFVILFYAVIFAVTYGWSDFKEWLRIIGQRAGMVGVGGGVIVLMIGLLLVWRAAVAVPDGLLHVTFLDVGSADGVLIKTPSGKNILINGGESVTTLSDGLGRKISSFDRRLDWLIVAATDENQVAALPRVLERYPPDHVLWSGNRQASFSAGVLNEYLILQSVPITDAEKDQVLDLGDGTTLTVLTTGPRGSVLLLEYQNFRVLLPVGMSFEVLDELRYGKSIGQVTILTLADSGYWVSNPEEWIQNLNPELVVLSVSAADPNGMPDDKVLATVKDHALLRTDQNGWIEIATNGVQMWVNVERDVKVEATELP